MHPVIMFGLFKKKSESPTGVGHRAFPATILHPSRARRFTPDEFAAIQKTKMQDAPSAHPGHTGTTIWYVEREGYIVEVRFDSRPSIYIHSICTFTPSFGMDRIDGEFAQDAEELLLHEVLGFESHRLDAFPASSDIPTDQYFKTKGFTQ